MEILFNGDGHLDRYALGGQSSRDTQSFVFGHTNGGNAYLQECDKRGRTLQPQAGWGGGGGGESLPRPKRDQETEPRKEEHATVLIIDVEDGDRSRLMVDWVDFRSLPQCCNSEAHGERVVRIRLRWGVEIPQVVR